jgi:hypothetical protein
MSATFGLLPKLLWSFVQDKQTNLYYFLSRFDVRFGWKADIPFEGRQKLGKNGRLPLLAVAEPPVPVSAFWQDTPPAAVSMQSAKTSCKPARASVGLVMHRERQATPVQLSDSWC